MIVTLAAIIKKFRFLTGAGNTLQITDSDVMDYINSFYSYDFPAEFRSLKLKDKYTFNTIQGIDTYPFNSEQYTTVEMPCYCSKREIMLFNDPWSFYGVNFNWQQAENFTFSNGGTGPYSGTLSAFPLVRSVNNNPQQAATPNIPPSTTVQTPPTLTYPQQGYSGYQAGRVQNILITTNTATGTLNVTDDGNGNLIGDCTAGTINYLTGVIANLQFTSAPPQGNQIQCQYNPVVPNIPLSIMFFQNQFTLRPVPDQGYTIELIAYRQPSQALLTLGAQAGTPELSEWWEALAFGAAKKFFEDRMDTDGVSMMDKALRERYDVAMTRTYAQLGKQRISTIYADQLTQNHGSSGWGFSSGGM